MGTDSDSDAQKGGRPVASIDVGKIMDYESGEMSDDDTINFFQELIDNGMAWELQGHYGRTAQALIEQGYCDRT